MTWNEVLSIIALVISLTPIATVFIAWGRINERIDQIGDLKAGEVKITLKTVESEIARLERENVEQNKTLKTLEVSDGVKMEILNGLKISLAEMHRKIDAMQAVQNGKLLVKT